MFCQEGRHWHEPLRQARPFFASKCLVKQGKLGASTHGESSCLLMEQCGEVIALDVATDARSAPLTIIWCMWYHSFEEPHLAWTTNPETDNFWCASRTPVVHVRWCRVSYINMLDPSPRMRRLEQPTLEGWEVNEHMDRCPRTFVSYFSFCSRQYPPWRRKCSNMFQPCIFCKTSI